MDALENHLNIHVPKHATGSDLKCWKSISSELSKKIGLEAALLKSAPTPAVEEIIVKLTAEFIEEAEVRILEEVITGKRTLAFSRLLPHLNPQPNRPLPVVTTNYERLIEASAEVLGWGVDSMFVGNTVGTLAPEISNRSFLKDVQIRSPRKVVYSYRNRISIFKPHGSMDWFQHTDGPVRCSIRLPLPRLIITPGRNKYFKGYAIPFDKHRDAGNSAIDKAARLLILGFGFNDEHLEPHLDRSLHQGKPGLILCRTLTPNALKMISQSPGTMAISHLPSNPNGFLFTTYKGQWEFDFAPIWNVETFVKNILKP